MRTAIVFVKSIAALCCMVGMLVVGGCFVTGCQTNNPPTAEAIKFNSLSATWKTTLELHNVYCELAVQGKVSSKDRAEIDKAWETFRKSFEIAARLAKNDWSQPTPTDVESAKDTLIIFIRSL